MDSHAQSDDTPRAVPDPALLTPRLVLPDQGAPVDPELPFYRMPAMKNILLLLGLCWTLELASRINFAFLGMPALVRDLFGMAAFGVLIIATYYVLIVVRPTNVVRRTLMVALVFLVVSQVSDVVDEFAWTRAYILLSKESSLHLMLEHMIFITGCLLLTLGCYFAIIEGETARNRLAQEREHLAEAVAEREQARLALARTSAALEQEVAARTAELAQANAQLRIELAERKRAEESIAMRLRYEEGLSACSQVLLSDSNPHEAITHGLEELLRASGAARVYVFENFEEDARGLCTRLAHEVANPAMAPESVRAVGLTLVYDEGFEDIRWDLAQGRNCMGTLGTFPISVRKLLQPYGTQSMLLLPLNWEGGWRGVLGFDATTHARIWTPEEIRILRTAAEMVAACRERQRADETLRSAYGELEQRVAARTADLTLANEQLQTEIAERQRAEEEALNLEVQLRQAQKMQAIGTLAGGIAHDFNNILASILGFSELALRKAATENGSRRYFEEILKAGNRAKELVRQILLFSRQTEHDLAPVHPHMVAKEALAMMRISAPPSIQIRHFIDSDSGRVLADPVQLHQAILNLGNNALHAMLETGGVLEMRVEPLALDARLQTPQGDVLPGAYVMVTVTDTGSGMDAHTLERIFDPFFTTKDIGQGTGLGLSMVHGIVNALGGVITAASAPGKGTTIRMYLPRCNEPETPRIHPAVEVLRGSERIMVVDDERQLLTLWTELLEQLGYRVCGFAHPTEALEAFRIDPSQFEMAVLDQKMPVMQGSELAERLLKLRPGLPIVIATGFSESITREKARAIGIHDVVYKPILGNDLGLAIRRALDGEQPILGGGEESGEVPVTT
jgi:signal transduction histidine kinase/CheY-like chemotaxis protein